MSQVADVFTMVIAALALFIWNSGGDRRGVVSLAPLFTGICR
jgi:hypothetical protein